MIILKQYITLKPIVIYLFSVSDSDFCMKRLDGNHHHYTLDYGDPRCTFIVCSNQRTIVQSCPQGTRTPVYMYPDRHYMKWMFSMGLRPPRPNTVSIDRVDKEYIKADRKSEENNVVERSQPRTWVDYIQAYRSMLLIQGSGNNICRYHDVRGDCGNPFPDMAAHDNRIPRVRNWQWSCLLCIC